MLYLLAFIVLSVLALPAALRDRDRTESQHLLTAIAMFSAAVLSVLYAAVRGQFAVVEWVVLPFGLIVGLIAAVGAYFFWRSQEEKSLLIEPWHLPVVLTLPILLSLTVFDSSAELFGLKAVGVGIGVVALFLIALGAPRTASDLSTGNRFLSTLLVLFLFALLFVGLQLFQAVVLVQNNEGVFLLLVFGIGGLVNLLLGLSKRQAFTGPVYNHGALLGALLFGALLGLLLGLKEMPGWEAFVLAAAGQVVLAALLSFFWLKKRPTALGLVGLLASAAAAILILLV
ncbi:MAG: hypothetical protein GX444_15230 [Myxococcales bacterium]|nr:hypothetical protein [Myxococcales bacterium]